MARGRKRNTEVHVGLTETLMKADAAESEDLMIESCGGAYVPLILGQCITAATTGKKSNLPDSLLQCSYIKDDEERLIMASPMNRHFFNLLGGYARRVLEIGAYMGGSAVAFAYDNDNEVVTIDNFSEEHGQESVREKCLAHVANAPNVRLIEADAMSKDLTDLGQFDLIFVDGHHGAAETRAVVKNVLPRMADVCLLVFDDWNLHPVQAAALPEVQGWKQHKIRFYHHAEGDMSNNLTSFWNGMCFILMVRE